MRLDTQQVPKPSPGTPWRRTASRVSAGTDYPIRCGATFAPRTLHIRRRSRPKGTNFLGLRGPEQRGSREARCRLGALRPERSSPSEPYRTWQTSRTRLSPKVDDTAYRGSGKVQVSQTVTSLHVSRANAFVLNVKGS